MAETINPAGDQSQFEESDTLKQLRQFTKQLRDTPGREFEAGVFEEELPKLAQLEAENRRLEQELREKGLL
jgi:hypothetical protein